MVVIATGHIDVAKHILGIGIPVISAFKNLRQARRAEGRGNFREGQNECHDSGQNCFFSLSVSSDTGLLKIRHEL